MSSEKQVLASEDCSLSIEVFDDGFCRIKNLRDGIVEHEGEGHMQTAMELASKISRVLFLGKCLSKQDVEIQQTLGKVLGYPWFFHDQKNFPGATEEDGVCVGDHVAESIAEEAAREIERLKKDQETLVAVYNETVESYRKMSEMYDGLAKFNERILDAGRRMEARLAELGELPPTRQP